MSEIVLILAMPLAALLIELGKRQRIPPKVLLAALSLVAGTCYVGWEMLLTPDLKAWVIAAYPLFAVGAVGFYEWAKLLTGIRDERKADEDAFSHLK